MDSESNVGYEFGGSLPKRHLMTQLQMIMQLRHVHNFRVSKNRGVHAHLSFISHSHPRLLQVALEYYISKFNQC